MGDYALAIDIGASGGRHILGRIVHGCVELTEVYHFPNEIVTRNGLQCWIWKPFSPMWSRGCAPVPTGA